jgi:hypothetical protein
MDSQENPRCIYCWDIIVYDENDPQHTGTIDHVFAEDSNKLRESGITYNDVANLVTACRACNSVKSAGTDDDWNYLQEYLQRKGVDWNDVLARLKTQMNSGIDDAWGKFYAERIYPKRREHLLEYGRARSLRKRYGDGAEEKRAELDAKKAKRKPRDEDDAPF